MDGTWAPCPRWVWWGTLGDPRTPLPCTETPMDPAAAFEPRAQSRACSMLTRPFLAVCAYAMHQCLPARPVMHVPASFCFRTPWPLGPSDHPTPARQARDLGTRESWNTLNPSMLVSRLCPRGQLVCRCLTLWGGPGGSSGPWVQAGRRSGCFYSPSSCVPGRTLGHKVQPVPVWCKKGCGSLGGGAPQWEVGERDSHCY